MPDYALSVDLELERSQLSQAANDLDDELSQYPPREPETPLPSHFMEAPRGVKSVSQGTQMSDLCQRIYRHCQARNWFGPDSGDDTSARIVPTQYDTFGDPFEVVKPPLFDTFAQPPATKYEIDQAEEKLQQELPGALKAIYLELANGGFGPGLGLATAGSLSGVSRGNWKVNERAATYLRDHPRRYLECDDLPEGFVRLCNWGCGLTSDLDVWSGHIYGRGAGIRSDWNSVSPEASEYVHWIAFQADSAEEWFDLWLRGVLRQPLSTLEAFENLLD
ncbi:MAG TPA: SMI1/KNR4 family protein [Ktedonobacterales bacterium]|nr:SMI1/KNR4 family protein [Ktedonobacterales bacterium]